MSEDDVLRRRLERSKAKVQVLEDMIESKTRELFLASRQVQSKHDELERILADMPSAFVDVDASGTIRRVNSATVELLQFTPEELVGQPLSLLSADPLLDGVGVLIERSRITRQALHYRRKDGSQFEVLFSSSTIRDPDGDVTGVACIALDLSALRALESLNVQLEDQVRQRTQELRVRVKELEGRDRIAQHMMAVHSEEDTIRVLLEVLTDVLEVDRACLYLVEDGKLKPTAARAGARSVEPRSVPLTGGRRQQVQRAIKMKSPVADGQDDPPYAAAPLMRGNDVMGLIVVDNPTSRAVVEPDAVGVLRSLCLAGAVAVHDARTQGDLSTWKSELSGVLDSVDDLGRA